MIRASLNATRHTADTPGHDVHVDGDGFRLLGAGFSRLDAFSDVVFGFALTLLVVSLEVPRSYIELHHLLRGFFPFAFSFLLLMLVWYGHFRLFQRFGMHDPVTIWLNGLLLFTVLFFVYPLKFLFVSVIGGVEFGNAHQVRELVVLYALGLAAIYFLFALLYANAGRQHALFGLTVTERKLTKLAALEEMGVGIIGLLVCGIAFLLRPDLSPNACWAFLLIGLWKTWMGLRSGRLARSAAEVTT